MKVIAYTTQYGNEIITVLNAKPGYDYYSTHKPGHRFPMFKRQGSKVPHFCYKSATSHKGTTNPETLTHTLCKQVIAELASKKTTTILKIKNTSGDLAGYPEVEITFEDGKVEFPIKTSGGTYYIDAFCRFKQPNAPSQLFSLEQRWEGRIAFEIFYSNSLKRSSPKCLDLEAEGIPVIQIAAGDEKGSLYIDEEKIMRMSEREADLAIQNHLRKLHNIFRKSIFGIVYNNPKSRIFREATTIVEESAAVLERCRTLEVALIQHENEAIEQSNKLQQIIANKDKEIEALKKQLDTTRANLESFRHNMQTLQEASTKQTMQNSELADANTKLQSKVENLEKSIPKTFWQKFKYLFK